MLNTMQRSIRHRASVEHDDVPASLQHYQRPKDVQTAAVINPQSVRHVRVQLTVVVVGVANSTVQTTCLPER